MATILQRFKPHPSPTEEISARNACFDQTREVLLSAYTFVLTNTTLLYEAESIIEKRRRYSKWSRMPKTFTWHVQKTLNYQSVIRLEALDGNFFSTI